MNMAEEFSEAFLETVRKRGADLEANPSKYLPLEKLECLNDLDVDEIERMFNELEDE